MSTKDVEGPPLAFYNAQVSRRLICSQTLVRLAVHAILKRP